MVTQREEWYRFLVLLKHLFPHLFSSSGEKVFGNGLYKVGCRHEDPNGAEDGEERESHEAEPVDNRRGKFPLVAHRAVLVVVAKPLGDKAHLVQDLGQLYFHVSHRGAGTWGEEHLILTCACNQPSAEDPGVGRGGSGGVLNALQAAEADVEHVAVVGLGGRGAGVEVHAGEAAPSSFVVTG